MVSHFGSLAPLFASDTFFSMGLGFVEEVPDEDPSSVSDDKSSASSWDSAVLSALAEESRFLGGVKKGDKESVEGIVYTQCSRHFDLL